MAEVTIMVLKVDLGCHRCYRKIKKLLCNYPAIRDQAFYEKEDTVIIKVVCCSPERIRQKLISKGGKTIKSIEIKVPEKPKPPPEKPKPPPEKPKELEKPKPPPEKPKEDPPKPVPAPAPPPVPDEPKSKPPAEKLVEAEKLKKAEISKPPADKLIVPEKPKPADPPKEKPVEKPPAPAPAPAPAPSPAPVPGYPQLQLFPVAVCCQPCYDLGHGGPCHHGYGTPYQLPSSHDGYVRLVPSYDEPSANWPSGCRCNRSYGCRCEFFTEENPACTIM